MAYNTTMQSHKRTPPYTERKVITLIAVGLRYADISEQTGVAVSTVKKIKKRNTVQLVQVEERITDYQVDEATRILRQTYKLLSKILDQAEAGSADISIRDLLAISKEMFSRSEVTKADHPIKPVNTRESVEQLRILIKSIRLNDTQSLARLAFSET